MQQYRYIKRTIFDKVLDHKYLVIFMTLFFLILGLLYIGFSNKVYRSSTTIEKISSKNTITADNYKKKIDLERFEQKYQNIKNILIKLIDGESYDDVLTLLSNVENKNPERLLISIKEEEKGYKQLLESYKESHPKMVELKKDITRKKITLKKNLVVLFKRLQNKKDNLKNSLEQKKSNPSLSANKDKPDLPSYHIKPKGFIVLPFFMIVGFIIGCILALIKDFLQKKIVVPEDIREISSKPLLGIVSESLTLHIRKSIEKYKKDKECLVVTVSSLIKDEDKTTVTSNLAVDLEDGENKVIVLSLDFRHPTIHKKFGVKNRFGLSSVMYDDMDINNAIKKVRGYNNLYILPSGSSRKPPIEIVNSDFVEALVRKLRKIFDFIVVELAPVSVAGESIYMMKQRDLNIFVLKSNYSKKESIKEIEELANSNGIENIAYVLNSLNKRYIKQNSILDKEK